MDQLIALVIGALAGSAITVRICTKDLRKANDLCDEMLEYIKKLQNQINTAR